MTTAQLDPIRTAAADLDEAQLLDCILEIGPGPVDPDARRVRAALLSLYEDLAGPSALDALLDDLDL